MLLEAKEKMNFNELSIISRIYEAELVIGGINLSISAKPVHSAHTIDQKKITKRRKTIKKTRRAKM